MCVWPSAKCHPLCSDEERVRAAPENSAMGNSHHKKRVAQSAKPRPAWHIGLGRRPGKKKAVTSQSDDEAKWTVHYTPSPYQHRQENVFLPSARPADIEDLHKEAELGLKSLQEQGTLDSCSQPQLRNVQDSMDNCSEADEDLPVLPNSRSGGPGDEVWTKTRSLPPPTPDEIRKTALGIQPSVSSAVIKSKPQEQQKTQSSFKGPKLKEKRIRRSTIMGLPLHVQEELGLGKGSRPSKTAGTEPAADNAGEVLVSRGEENYCFNNLSHLQTRSSLRSVTFTDPSRVDNDSRNTLEHNYQLNWALINSRNRPNSLAVPKSPGELSSPVMSMSPQATYLSKIIPNAILPPAVDVVMINTSQNSLRTLSNSSVLSTPSPAISRSISIHTYDARDYASSDAWSHSQSSETIVSNNSTISSQGNTETPLNNHFKQEVGEKADHNLTDSPVNNRASTSRWVSACSAHQNSQPTQASSNGYGGQSLSPAQSTCSIVDASDTHSMISEQSVTRSLSVRKMRKPPAPPQRMHSLQQSEDQGHAAPSLRDDQSFQPCTTVDSAVSHKLVLPHNGTRTISNGNILQSPNNFSPKTSHHRLEQTALSSLCPIQSGSPPTVTTLVPPPSPTGMSKPNAPQRSCSLHGPETAPSTSSASPTSRYANLFDIPPPPSSPAPPPPNVRQPKFPAAMLYPWGPERIPPPPPGPAPLPPTKRPSFLFNIATHGPRPHHSPPASTPTPAPTPLVTPTPAPTPLVTSTPAPTPLVTPTPAPTPLVIPTPAPAPLVISTPAPTPLVTPTPAPTPLVISTPAPIPLVTPTPAPTPLVIPTPAPTPMVIPTPAPTPLVTPTPAPTPLVTPTPAPTPLVTPTPAPTPLVTPTPAPTPLVTPTPAPTPLVTSTPAPTPLVTPTSSPTPLVTSSSTPTTAVIGPALLASDLLPIDSETKPASGTTSVPGATSVSVATTQLQHIASPHLVERASPSPSPPPAHQPPPPPQRLATDQPPPPSPSTVQSPPTDWPPPPPLAPEGPPPTSGGSEASAPSEAEFLFPPPPPPLLEEAEGRGCPENPGADGQREPVPTHLTTLTPLLAPLPAPTPVPAPTSIPSAPTPTPRLPLGSSPLPPSPLPKVSLSSAPPPLVSPLATKRPQPKTQSASQPLEGPVSPRPPSTLPTPAVIGGGWSRGGAPLSTGGGTDGEGGTPHVAPSLLQMVRLRSGQMNRSAVAIPDPRSPVKGSTTTVLDPVPGSRGPSQATLPVKGSTAAPSKPVRKSLTQRLSTTDPGPIPIAPLQLGSPPLSPNAQGSVLLKHAEEETPLKSPASTASFIFSKNVGSKKLVFDSPRSPEAEAEAKRNLMAELSSVSGRMTSKGWSGLSGKAAPEAQGKTGRVPPPVAKKPSFLPAGQRLPSTSTCGPEMPATQANARLQQETSGQHEEKGKLKTGNGQVCLED
ncbi:uncharacterized protein KIAA1522 homolog [Amblyraja radiata]|uniref:uncharacterized protein KIAA1522 homolog n=1 Tax=Amblyraja radiata TaxID=386614 RepID=UPI0014039A68|nr:uncharacterized protein KIAA1522 homolog [Amblyraja radiata]